MSCRDLKTFPLVGVQINKREPNHPETGRNNSPEMLLGLVARHCSKRCRLSSSCSSFPSPRQLSYTSEDTDSFKLRRALIVSKLSRFEFEKLRYPELNAGQLERRIRERGTDYDSLIHYNEQHVDFRKQVVDCFKRNNVEVKVVYRSVRVLISFIHFLSHPRHSLPDCPSTARRSIGQT